MAESILEVIGCVTAFFVTPSSAVIALTAPLTVGEFIWIKGHTTEFQQRVMSMQIQHRPVEEVSAGQVVGLKTIARCRKHDVVYRLATRSIS